MLKQNLTNHFCFLIDSSTSIRLWKNNVVKAVDEQVKALVSKSKELNQETRISIYTFSDPHKFQNIVFDMDVMRYTTINDMYDPHGNTALLDAIHDSYVDLKTISQLYTEHAFVILVITDGEENCSFKKPYQIEELIQNSPPNFTFSALVPNNPNVMVGFGFDKGNVAVWETSEKGFEQYTQTVNSSLANYMTQRATTGLVKSKNLFQVDTKNLSQTDVRKAAQVLNPTDFTLIPVGDIPPKTWISNYVELKGYKYKLGKAYYQLLKPEKIQPQKEVILRCKSTGTFFYGKYVRQLLNLPDYEIRVSPGDYGDWDIFVQSTSINRHLQPYSNLVVLK